LGKEADRGDRGAGVGVAPVLDQDPDDAAIGMPVIIPVIAGVGPPHHQVRVAVAAIPVHTVAVESVVAIAKENVTAVTAVATAMAGRKVDTEADLPARMAAIGKRARRQRVKGETQRRARECAYPG